MADEIESVLDALSAGLVAELPELAKLEAYHEGTQPLRFMAPALKDRLDGRVSELVMNFPELLTNAYENRLDVDGIRYRGNSSGDDYLGEVWQANGMDEQAQLAHLDALAIRRAYVIVGSGDTPSDLPVITVESATQVYAHRSPRTRKIDMAVKRWTEGTGDNIHQMATLYLPNTTLQYEHVNRKWKLLEAPDNHNMGVVPVVALANQPKLLKPDGRSEFQSILGLADACNKMLTDMMVSGEFHAMPRRWVFGLKESDFQDGDGNPLDTWSVIAGNLWSSETDGKDINIGQFQEADLRNFHDTVKLLTEMILSQSGLPQHYSGHGGDNPASADAIRSSEAQLVKRVERKHTYFGGAWEDVCRLVLRIKNGGVEDLNGRKLETMWRDPATPTRAQMADAIVKLASTPADRPILPVEQARIDLGYSSEARKEMLAMDKRQAALSPFALKPLGEDDPADTTDPAAAAAALAGGIE